MTLPLSTVYLREPAVGGEDLILLVHVHDLVEGDTELHDERQAGVLHGPDGLKVNGILFIPLVSYSKYTISIGA